MSIGKRNFQPGGLSVDLVIEDSPPPIKKKPVKIEQVFEQKKPEQPIRSNPSYNFQPYLYGDLQRSSKQLSFAQKNLIQHQMNLVETKVHDIEAGEGQETALRNIYKNSISQNQYIDDGIKNVVKKASDNVVGGITEKMKPLRHIPKTKDDIKELEKVDKYRMLKIKNGQIKNKIGDLRSELEHEYYVKKANYRLPNYQNVKQSDYFSMNNPKTHEANQFVHKLQLKRSQERQKYQQYLEQKRQQMEYKKQIQLQKMKVEAEERRLRLEEIYKQKQMKRKIEEEQLNRKRQDYNNWSKMYAQERPLHVRREKQYYKNIVQPQINKRAERLLEIKLERKPIDVSEINDHEEKYLDQKRDVAVRIEAELELQRQRQQQNEQKIEQLYKGKYRYLALEEMMNQKLKYQEDPRDYQREKKARQIVYAQEVNDRLFQQIRLKQQEAHNLEKKQFTKRKRNIDGSVSLDVNDQTKMTSYTDPKVDGKKNLQFMKQLVREKGIKKDRPIIKLVQQKNVYPDYLEQIHQKRKRRHSNIHSSNIQQESLDFSHGSPQIKQLIAREKNLNEKVKRGQVRKRYNSLDYKEDAGVQQNEIEVARLKLKMIQQLN